MAYLYHGSPIGGLKVLKPYPSDLQDGRSVLFAGKRWVAISNVQKWTDGDIKQGTVNGKPYMKEVYSGAFDMVYHQGGYLYTVPSQRFKRDDIIYGYEYYSETPVKPIKVEFIEDPVAELQKLGVLMIRYEQHINVFSWGNPNSEDTIFHLSKDPNIIKLIPAIPKVILNNIDKTWENTTIPRISFANTIEGCLLGLQLNEDDFNGKPYIILYAYIPSNVSKSATISNAELITNKFVFDANITGEVWITRPVYVKKIYRIKVFSYKLYNEEIEYTPIIVKDKLLLNKNGKLVSYKLKYKILNKY